MNTKFLRILFISITLFLAFPFFKYYFLDDNKIEKFTNSDDYNKCRTLGLTKEFCLENPLPNQCQCSDGRLGIFQKGFKGKCVCSNILETVGNIYYTSNYDHNRVIGYNI